jgi:hypothetical protein
MGTQENVAGAAMPRMADRIEKVATAWLPPSLTKNIEAFEQGNFLNLVKAVEEVSASIPDAAAACAKQQSLLDADALLVQMTTCAARPSFQIKLESFRRGLVRMACCVLLEVQRNSRFPKEDFTCAGFWRARMFLTFN